MSPLKVQEEAHSVCCVGRHVLCRMRRGLSVGRGGVRNAPKHRGRVLFDGSATNALVQTTEQQILAV